MRKLLVRMRLSQIALRPELIEPLPPHTRRLLARMVTDNYVAFTKGYVKPPTQGLGVSGFEAFGPMGAR